MSVEEKNKKKKQVLVGCESHRELMTSIMENGSLTFQKCGISGSLERGIGNDHSHPNEGAASYCVVRKEF